MEMGKPIHQGGASISLGTYSLDPLPSMLEIS